MPIKNRVKTYRKGGVYHIYNRGLDGREVFGVGEDYEMWIKLMDRYIGGWKENQDPRFKGERPYIVRHKLDMNLGGEVSVLAYCLLPDHFHMLVRQETEDGITKLMRRLMTNYVMYYNRKYRRRGMLFENVYRGILMPSDEVAVWMTKYIHINPVVKSVRRFGLVETSSITVPEYYLYSSYKNYLEERNDKWVDSSWIKERMKLVFRRAGGGISYKEFVEDDTRWKLPDMKQWTLE